MGGYDNEICDWDVREDLFIFINQNYPLAENEEVCNDHIFVDHVEVHWNKKKTGKKPQWETQYWSPPKYGVSKDYTNANGGLGYSTKPREGKDDYSGASDGRGWCLGNTTKVPEGWKDVYYKKCYQTLRFRNNGDGVPPKNTRSVWRWTRWQPEVSCGTGGTVTYHGCEVQI